MSYSPRVFVLCLGLAAHLAACASPPAPAGRPPSSASAPPPVGVRIFVVSAGGPELQPRDAVRLGCDEHLVPQTVTVQGGPKAAIAREALARALAQSPEAAQLAVERVTESPDGVLQVSLTGRVNAAGVCALPRLTGVVSYTLRQFGRAQIHLNGSVRDWRCLGDASGDCR